MILASSHRPSVEAARKAPRAVAATEGASQRSWEWWDSNEVKCMTGGCVPLFGASWTNTDRTKND